MTWRRLPSFFPNLSLRLLPLDQAAQETFAKTGFLSPLTFRVAPSVNKIEIKAFLESVYGLNVTKVNTLNYEGRKKRDKFGMYRRNDWKKAYVHLKPQPGAGQQ